MSKPTEPYDPQTLDHYQSFHKEIDRKGYMTIAAYSAVFAPAGWFICIQIIIIFMHSDL